MAERVEWSADASLKAEHKSTNFNEVKVLRKYVYRISEHLNKGRLNGKIDVKYRERLK